MKIAILDRDSRQYKCLTNDNLKVGDLVYTLTLGGSEMMTFIM